LQALFVRASHWRFYQLAKKRKYWPNARNRRWVRQAGTV